MEDIKRFVARLNEEVKADPFFENFDNGSFPTYAIAKGGRKYLKVVMTSHGQDSVWGFVERETGLIFKAAGWSSPAKHARGHIDTGAYGKNYVWTGPNYLR